MSTDKLAEIVGRDTGTTRVCRLIREAFVVIDRNDLPTVTTLVRPDRYRSTMPDGSDFEHYGPVSDPRKTGLHYLAIAEYVDANPPVDEKAVEALVKTLRVSGVVGPRGVALALLADGWKREAKP